MFAYICLLLIITTPHIQPVSPAIPIKATTSVATVKPKLPPAIPLTYAFDYEASIIFKAINFPVKDISDSFTKNILEQIEQNFGPKGLNLTTAQIALINKTYLYLIFLTKLEIIKTDSASKKPKFKKYYSDFLIKNFILPNFI